MNSLIPNYNIRRGSTLDRALLVKFMQRTYQDMFPGEDFSHLAQTVEQYFSSETPLWWVDFLADNKDSRETRENLLPHLAVSDTPVVACLWVGNSIDQVKGDRHAHIFLVYVEPEHRRQGIGKALMQYVENWAFTRGDRQIGLQVFTSNQTALNLYNQLGYQTQSLWMIKPLNCEKIESE